MRKIVTNLKRVTQRHPRVAIGVAVVLLAGLIWLGVANDKQVSKTAVTEEARIATVSITANGFEPATLAVEPGTKIIWTNNDTKAHQVAANPHPTRDELPELYSEILNEGQSYEFTAQKNGSFGYHDQLNPLTNGTLEVK